VKKGEMRKRQKTEELEGMAQFAAGGVTQYRNNK
jgi:hypothetical protein